MRETAEVGLFWKDQVGYGDDDDDAKYWDESGYYDCVLLYEKVLVLDKYAAMFVSIDLFGFLIQSIYIAYCFINVDGIGLFYLFYVYIYIF